MESLFLILAHRNLFYENILRKVVPSDAIFFFSLPKAIDTYVIDATPSVTSAWNLTRLATHDRTWSSDAAECKPRESGGEDLDTLLWETTSGAWYVRGGGLFMQVHDPRVSARSLRVPRVSLRHPVSTLDWAVTVARVYYDTENEQEKEKDHRILLDTITTTSSLSTTTTTTTTSPRRKKDEASCYRLSPWPFLALSPSLDISIEAEDPSNGRVASIFYLSIIHGRSRLRYRLPTRYGAEWRLVGPFLVALDYPRLYAWFLSEILLTCVRLLFKL